MQLILKIPNSINTALRLPESEKKERLLKELGLTLYDKGILSFGKARALAGLSKWEFNDLLGIRKIPRHYTDEDFHEDMSYGKTRRK